MSRNRSSRTRFNNNSGVQREQRFFERPRVLMECPQCPTTFKLESAYRDHYRKQHSKVDRTGIERARA